MARKLNEITKQRIIQYLDSDFGEPKRFSEIWEYCKLMNLFKTPKTLKLYLDKLREEGMVNREEKSRKFVTYEHNYEGLQKKYENIMKEQFQILSDGARKTILKIRNDDIAKEKIESVIADAWNVFQDKAVICFELILDGKGKVSVIADRLIEDWVKSPFKLSSLVMFECFKKYPTETKEALAKLRIRASG